MIDDCDDDNIFFSEETRERYGSGKDLRIQINKRDDFFMKEQFFSFKKMLCENLARIH